MSHPRLCGNVRGCDHGRCEVDGTNVDGQIGSTAPQALQQKVLETRADIGIALDGDADRLINVDEKGKIVDGDQNMALIATGWQRRGCSRAAPLWLR